MALTAAFVWFSFFLLLLKLGLSLKQALQLLCKHYVAFDLELARHVGLCGIQLARHLRKSEESLITFQPEFQ